MKNYYSIVLAFLAFLILTSGSDAVIKPRYSFVDELGSEGLACFVVNDNGVYNVDNEVSCECDNGYITHGDGHRTKCPCDNCQCASGAAGASAVVNTPEQPEKSRYYVVKWTQNYCTPCAKWDREEKPKLLKEGVDYSEINISKEPEKGLEFNIRSVPAIWVCERVGPDSNKVLKKFDYVKAEVVLEYLNGL